MSLQALALSFEVQAAAWVLLHFVWQGSVIAALLWLALAGLPRAHASLRYAACAGALGLLALSPPITFWVLLAQRPTAVALPMAVEAVAGLGTELRAGLGAGGLSVEQGSYLALWLLAAWGLGSVLMLLRLLFGLSVLRRLVASATPAAEHWQLQLARLTRRVQLRQRVRLLISEHVDAPVVLGWLRPVILVPLAALSALPPAYVEALLAHELGHVRRLDYLVNVLQSCVEALLFYHPAVYWVSRCMRTEREHCCDDIAIEATGEPLGYARALAEMETLRARLPEPALAANGGNLMSRIERILKRPAVTRAEPRALLTASCVLVSALGLALAGVWACSSPSEPAAATPLDTKETVEQASSAAAEPAAAEPAAAEPAAAEPAAAEPAAPALAVRWLPASIAPYEAALEDAAQRHGVDPALLAIVTLVESLGDPRAQSSMGARGLMQLMPATAAQIASERDLPGHSDERLFEPEYNIDLGAWFLSRQLTDFGAGAASTRAVELAAVAYNVGPHWARRYLEGKATLPAETVRYRELIVGMWNERLQPESATFSAWQQQLKASAAQP